MNTKSITALGAAVALTVVPVVVDQKERDQPHTHIEQHESPEPVGQLVEVSSTGATVVSPIITPQNITAIP